MPKESESTEQIMSEIKALRWQVAELRGIEQRCQQAEAHSVPLKKVGDSAPLGIFTIDTQGGITGITRKMLEMFPWPSVDDPKSMNLSDCQAMVASGIFGDIQRCIDQKEPVMAEHPYTNPGYLRPFALLSQSHTWDRWHRQRCYGHCWRLYRSEKDDRDAARKRTPISGSSLTGSDLQNLYNIFPN